MDIEAYELVVLRRPPDATSYDDATLERIQAEHLAYLESLRETGLVVTHGPVLDQPDKSVRGLMFFCVGSLEEARRVAEDDPAVRAGRLAVDVMTWWCPAGTMTRPGRPVSVDERA